MNRKYYIAVCMKNCGKQWAFVKEIHGRLNLVGMFDDFLGILSANICDSKKEAFRIVEAWNNEFKRAGVFPG